MNPTLWPFLYCRLWFQFWLVAYIRGGLPCIYTFFQLWPISFLCLHLTYFWFMCLPFHRKYCTCLKGVLGNTSQDGRTQNMLDASSAIYVKFSCVVVIYRLRFLLRMTSLNRVSNCCSFNDVQNAMPQKSWSACLHGSHIGTSGLYRIIFHIWRRPETDLEISECTLLFFSVKWSTHWIVSHMSKKKKSELGHI